LFNIYYGTAASSAFTALRFYSELFIASVLSINSLCILVGGLSKKPLSLVSNKKAFNNFSSKPSAKHSIIRFGNIISFIKIILCGLLSYLLGWNKKNRMLQLANNKLSWEIHLLHETCLEPLSWFSKWGLKRRSQYVADKTALFMSWI
jgi:hypothetical protein